MLSNLSKFFQKEGIDCWAPIPLSDCTITKPYLLERHGMEEGTVIMVCIPYFTQSCLDPERNLSSYAVSRDYHLFCKDLFSRLQADMSRQFPSYRFAAFADHSPIAEVEAAAKAGLGVIGKNHLLLTKRYSSYVFLGELITNAILPCNVGDVKACIGCNRCTECCPADSIEECLSALTQKKGDLSPEEKQRLLEHPLVWGCDVCQEVCPYTQQAIKDKTIFSPIPFFSQNTIAKLSIEALSLMSDAEFMERAYSWRGRETIFRNLKIKEEKGETVC